MKKQTKSQKMTGLLLVTYCLEKEIADLKKLLRTAKKNLKELTLSGKSLKNKN